MQATKPLVQNFGSYIPEVERRRHVSVDSPGLRWVHNAVRELIIAHDREFIEPREGFHSALLLDHSETGSDVGGIVAKQLGFSNEEVFLVEEILFYHDFSKTRWHGHRYDGPLPETEIAGKDAHACMSQIMLSEIARLLPLNGDERHTIEKIGVGVHFHHTPEDLAKIAVRSRLIRELKMVTLVHFVDYYIANREERGKSHPGRDHAASLKQTIRHSMNERFDYARSEVDAIVDALDSPEVERRMCLEL